MKILLFITGHSQINEYNYFNRFLKTLTLNNICDIFIYCNNPNISKEIVTYYQEFSQKNKQLFITTKNGGYRTGGVEAVSDGIEMGIFKDYDYVIHLHPDIFITDDDYLLTILRENLENDTVFFITKSNPEPNFFSFDFFIFKPKLLRQNIFIEDLYTFTELPEEYLCKMIINYNIKYSFIKRFNNDYWWPRRIDENLKLWHEHELHKVENELKNRNLL
jgi:hypothetical protein